MVLVFIGKWGICPGGVLLLSSYLTVSGQKTVAKESQGRWGLFGLTVQVCIPYDVIITTAGPHILCSNKKQRIVVHRACTAQLLFAQS